MNKRITATIFILVPFLYSFVPVTDPIKRIPLPQARIDILDEQLKLFDEFNRKENYKYSLSFENSKLHNFYLKNHSPIDISLKAEESAIEALNKAKGFLRLRTLLTDLQVEKMITFEGADLEKEVKKRFGKTLGELLSIILHSNRGRNILRLLQRDFGLTLGDIIREVQREQIHITFRQTYSGYPVHGGSVLVHMLKGKEPYYINGVYFPEISLSNQLILLEDPASNIAKSDLANEGAGGIEIKGATVVILPVEDKFVLAYEITLTTISPHESWNIFVDGETGQIYGRISLINPVTTGTGSVYVHHPLVSPVTNEPLPNLSTSEQYNGFLVGAYAFILNNEDVAAKSLTYQFIYPPDNTHFDEANAYYQIDKVHEYFKSRTGFIGLDTSVVGLVHYDDCRCRIFFTGNYCDCNKPEFGCALSGYIDNAFFNPATKFLYFGHGTLTCGASYTYSLHDLAKEEAVIYHEYTHAVNDVVKGSSALSDAINEGTADYFAASFSGDPWNGEYSGQNQPVETCGGGIPRTVNNLCEYSENFGQECHRDGNIFSGALWDYRNDVVGRGFPPDVADKVILNGIANITPNLPGADTCDEYTSQQLINLFRDALNGLEAASKNSVIPNFTVNKLLWSFANHGVFKESRVALVRAVADSYARDTTSPPSFGLFTGDAETSFNHKYKIQLTTDRSLFLPSHSSQRTSSNWYESGTFDETDIGYDFYTMPLSVFQTFANANTADFNIFYRVITWDICGWLVCYERYSTPDSDYTIAPFVTVTAEPDDCGCSLRGGNRSLIPPHWIYIAFSCPVMYILLWKYSHWRKRC